MKKTGLLLLLLPMCVQAQLSGRIDSLGRKQGEFNEKMLFDGYTDSLGRKQGAWAEKQLFPAYADSLSCVMHYKDGKLSGAYNCTQGSKIKLVSGNYTNGQKNGDWTFKKADGITDHIVYYDKGSVDWQVYYAIIKKENDTSVIRQTIYKDAKGRTTKIENYEDSKLVKEHTTFWGRTKIDDPEINMNLRGPWVVSAGYTYQRSSWMELGVKKYSHLADHDAFDLVQGITYALAGAEINFDKHTQIAPKLGIGHYFTFSVLNCNLNCILYNDQFQKFYPAFTPEIGFSLPVAFVQVNYGYNIFFVQNAFTKNITHRLSIRINIPFLSTGK